MSEDVAPIVSGPTARLGLGTRSPHPFPRANVMGVPLDACSAEQFVATVESWVDDGEPALGPREVAVGDRGRELGGQQLERIGAAHLQGYRLREPGY